jgi:methionyl-tRNA formyltransferase
VASCSQVLRDAALSAPRLGAVNLHPSLLPKLPGPNPWFWHYYFMEAVGGVTAHRMTARADAGPILRQERFSTPLGMEFEDRERQAGLTAGRCALKALEDLAAGAPGRPQAGGETFYARRVKRGERLIDWEGWPLERVWHVLKGTRAWLDALPPTGGWRRWSVGEKEPGPPAPAGRISRDGRGWYVGHRGGKIRLGLRYDWPEAVKALGRGVERTAKGWEGSARTELAG